MLKSMSRIEPTDHNKEYSKVYSFKNYILIYTVPIKKRNSLVVKAM